MKTYLVRVVVRPDGFGWPGSGTAEGMMEGKVRATDEVTARRKALECVWARGLLVSTFLHLAEVKKEKE